MRRERQFIGGRSPIRADYLNRSHAEHVRREKVSLDNSLDGSDDGTGLAIRGKAKPAPRSITVTNAAGVQIPAYGYIQLLTYDGDADTWTGMVPAYPGLVLVAICGEDPIDPQGSGTAYAPWANPGLIKVLSDPTYPDGGTTDPAGWLVCKANSSTAQPTRGLTSLKVVNIPPPPPPDPNASPPPPPPDPKAPITVYAAFSGGWLG